MFIYLLIDCQDQFLCLLLSFEFSELMQEPKLSLLGKVHVLSTRFIFSRAWHRLHISPRLAPVANFPRLVPVAYFPVLGSSDSYTGYNFWRPVLIGSLCCLHLLLVTRLPGFALSTAILISFLSTARFLALFRSCLALLSQIIIA